MKCVCVCVRICLCEDAADEKYIEKGSRKSTGKCEHTHTHTLLKPTRSSCPSWPAMFLSLCWPVTRVLDLSPLLLLLLLDRYHLTHISLLLMTSAAAIITQLGETSPGCHFCIDMRYMSKVIQFLSKFLQAKQRVLEKQDWVLFGKLSRGRLFLFAICVWAQLKSRMSASSSQRWIIRNVDLPHQVHCLSKIPKTPRRLTLILQVCAQTTQISQVLQHHQQVFLPHTV